MKDPNLEREKFLDFVKKFWDMTETQIDQDGKWTYYDKGVSQIISVQPVKSKTYKHEYIVRIIRRFED